MLKLEVCISSIYFDILLCGNPHNFDYASYYVHNFVTFFQFNVGIRVYYKFIL